MKILLTNDDGILAPGLAAMAKELSALGDVAVIAPLMEQSGVGHAITFLSPIKYREVTVNGQFWGWGIEGTPSDCVRMGIEALLDSRPDLVVSGINSGLNAGINVHYSGTCSAAIEGRFFGATAFAVSIQKDAPDLYGAAAQIAVQIIRQTLERQTGGPKLYNLNMPNRTIQAFLDGVEPEIAFAPMDNRLYGEKFVRGESPFGLPYYWCAANGVHEPPEFRSDITELKEGKIVLTPLDYNMTDRGQMEQMSQWGLKVSNDVPPAEVDPEKEYPDVYLKRM